MVKLEKSTKFEGVKGPLLTIVMDGVGIAPDNGANAVAAAHTPTLDMLMKNYPTVAIKAHGTAVGLCGICNKLVAFKRVSHSNANTKTGNNGCNTAN